MISQVLMISVWTQHSSREKVEYDTSDTKDIYIEAP